MPVWRFRSIFDKIINLRCNTLIGLMMLSACTGEEGCGVDGFQDCETDLDCSTGQHCLGGYCVVLCDHDNNCPIPGQGCLSRSTPICDGICSQERCAVGSECVDNSCKSVPCGFFVTCQTPDDICDPWTHRCLPANGDCSAHGCPVFTPVQSIASIDCEGSAQLCRTHRRTIRIADLPAASIAIASPEPGQSVPSDQPLSFRWDAARDVVILNVFDRQLSKSDTLDQLKEHLIWGAFSLPASPPHLTWDDGFAVRNGIWQFGSPDRPSNGPYYLLIISIHEDQVTAASNVVAFWSGSSPSWFEQGAHCSGELAIPGECENPKWPQVCWHDRCYRLCTSDLDCPNSTCDRTNADGFRVCTL